MSDHDGPFERIRVALQQRYDLDSDGLFDAMTSDALDVLNAAEASVVSLKEALTQIADRDSPATMRAIARAALASSEGEGGQHLGGDKVARVTPEEGS